MIRRILYSVAVVFAVLLNHAETFAEPSVATPPVVVRFYNAMCRMPNVAVDSVAYRISEEMRHCFMHYDYSGVVVSNDFREFGYMANDMTITSSLYCQKFYEKRRAISVVADIKKSYIIREVDIKQFSQDMYNPALVETIALRKMTIAGKSIEVYDTLQTEGELIYSLLNGKIGNNVSIETLRAKAASCFYREDYKEAFEIYKTIISKDSKNANAYYRLGILAFWYGKKCGYRSKKAGQKAGRDYMRLAEFYDFPRASQVLYYMRPVNVSI